MPAPLAVDRDAVKAHAITHGVREAARAFDLSEETVKAWSRREGWLANAGKLVCTQPLPASIRPVQRAPDAPKASEAARNTLERLGARAKLNAAKTAVNGFRHSAKLDGESVLDRASDLASLSKLAATVLPGFAERPADAGPKLGISLTSGDATIQVIV